MDTPAPHLSVVLPALNEEETIGECIRKIQKVFADRDKWKQLVRRAMERDLSWERSAEAYEKVYIDTLSK